MRAKRPPRKYSASSKAKTSPATATASAALAGRLFLPVDAAVLAYFRIVFGVVMCWSLTTQLASGGVYRDFIAPRFHFSYYGFQWIRPLPDDGMYVVFGLLTACSLLLAVGFLYRLAAVGFTAGFVYVFLIDRAYYLNHEYLVCLLGFLLIVLPCHRVASVDAWLRPSLRSDVVPAWSLWLLRFQIALPYVFGGIAKLNLDWLRGQPMRSWLPESPIPHLVGPVVEGLPAALFFSWGGLLFDLLVVPMLLWKRTRLLATVVAIFFHLTNAVMLDIGIFPWLMIGAILIFYPADWPRKLLQGKPAARSTATTAAPALTGKRRLIVGLLAAYFLIHVLLPFRHFFYPGNPSWTEEGHNFAWRMMLRDKNTILQFLKRNHETGTVSVIDIRPWLNRFQMESMGHDTEMQRQFARFLAGRLRDDGEANCSIHVVAIASLNGRKPQLLVDPAVDLAQQPPTLSHKPWIVPLTEPFRHEPWDVPVVQWPQYVQRPADERK